MGSDAIVVGAGPAGLIAAKWISSHGFSVKILEEHTKIGVPCHCAGLVSVEGIERIGVEPSSRWVQNKVYGGRIYSPDGQCIEIRDTRPRAYVIDRIAFDQGLAEAAVDRGADLQTGRRVEKLTAVNGVFKGVSGTGWMEEARALIDAEGPSRRLAKQASLSVMGRKPLLGVNTEVKCVMDPEMVEVWFGREAAPGFFAWVIPTSDGEARVGLATSEGDPAILLAGFVKKRFGNLGYEAPRVGQVLVDGPIAKTAYPGLLLVGDAAGQVKATTGGGVVLGGLCALEAGRATVKTLEGDPDALAGYEEAWRSLYGSEFRSMQTLRSFADRVSDERMNRFFHAYIKAGIGDLVSELVASGDMDMQEGVIRRALGEPRLVKAVIRGLGRLALDELRSLVNL